MNLYYNPSITELQKLVAFAIPTLPDHYIAVDFDGEVIIDPDFNYPGVDISKYKFYTQISHSNLFNNRRLEMLLDSLITSFEDNYVIEAYDSDLRMAA